VERRYRALALGSIESERGVIDAPLGRSPRDPAVRAVVVGGRPARTAYQVSRRGELLTSDPHDHDPDHDHDHDGDRNGAPGGIRSDVIVSELECRLESGRTHQIRAHLLAIGHPVYGDVSYGGRPPAPLTPVEPLGRPFLHAETLGFDHPATGQRLHFTSPLPEDLVAVLARVVPVTEQAAD
jgi:23S rRNA pseudouridine1911/1915/1917 synthase